MVDERQLEMDGAVKIIEEVAPVLKDRALVLVLSKLIIDVIETDRFGVETVLHAADPVASHLLIGNGFLCRDFLFLCLP